MCTAWTFRNNDSFYKQIPVKKRKKYINQYFLLRIVCIIEDAKMTKKPPSIVPEIQSPSCKYLVVTYIT